MKTELEIQKQAQEFFSTLKFASIKIVKQCKKDLQGIIINAELYKDELEIIIQSISTQMLISNNYCQYIVNSRTALIKEINLHKQANDEMIINAVEMLRLINITENSFN